MRIYSSDLIGTAQLEAGNAAAIMKRVYEERPPDSLAKLKKAREELLQSASELTVAIHGIERRNPNFDTEDSDPLIYNIFAILDKECVV